LRANQRSRALRIANFIAATSPFPPFEKWEGEENTSIKNLRLKKLRKIIKTLSEEPNKIAPQSKKYA
jgi:hypothetical protein